MRSHKDAQHLRNSKHIWLKAFVKGLIGTVHLYDNVKRNECNAMLRRAGAILLRPQRLSKMSLRDIE